MHASQEAPFWLGETMQDLPMFPPLKGAQGTLAGNSDIVKGLPLFLDKNMRRAALKSGLEEHLHVSLTRATPYATTTSEGTTA
mmetsp:Transcript_12600/g.36792  ORF Transcript_12600/g.36792 Transcript_12600/m.36792 type:complete len:83 (-) Transcript_12600:652-900(-)